MSPEPPPLLSEYKDRRTGLILFGILEILLGGFFALSLPMAVFGQIMTAQRAGAEISWGQLAASLAHVGALATALIWLGIGSMLARRWARAILLCGAWIGLVTGVMVTAMLPFTIPAMRVAMQQAQQSSAAVPPAVFDVILYVTLGVLAAFYILVPGAMALFYRSPHVKRTCEARDPIVRWTDRCPLPVLGVVLLLAYGAFAMAIMLPQYGRAFFVFGSIIMGAPAYACWLVLLGLTAFLVRAPYRLDRPAWWIALGLWGFCGVNAIVTFSSMDLLDYYRALQIPEAQLALIRQSPLLQGHRLLWATLPSWLAGFGYLLWVRRYFSGAPASGGDSTAPADPPAV